MKIIVDKHEYAELVRACVKYRNNHANCYSCLLAELCDGYEFMESMCEITEADDVPVSQQD